MDVKYEVVQYELGAQYIVHKMNGIHTRSHWHREVELVYVINGSIRASVGQDTFCVPAKHMLIINSEQIHSLDSDDDEPSKAELFVLQFHEQLFKSMGQALNTLFFKRMIDLSSPDVSEYTENLCQCMRDIRKELGRKEGYDQNNVQMTCCQILALLIRHYNEFDGGRQRRFNDKGQLRMKQIFSYIAANFKRDISLDDLSAYMGKTAAYLSRLFVSYTNTSFTRYLNAYRVENALRDLAETTDSITDIYLRNGFNSGKTFNRVFHGLLGMSPREYRHRVYEEKGQLTAGDSRMETSVGTYVRFISPEPDDLQNSIQGFQFSDSVIRRETDAALPQQAIEWTLLPGAPSTVFHVPLLKMIDSGRAQDVLLADWRRHFEIC